MAPARHDLVGQASPGPAPDELYSAGLDGKMRLSADDGKSWNEVGGTIGAGPKDFVAGPGRQALRLSHRRQGQHVRRRRQDLVRRRHRLLLERPGRLPYDSVAMAFHRDASDPLGGERIGRVHEELRLRSRVVSMGTLACPRCDAPVAPGGRRAVARGADPVPVLR